MTKHEFLPMLNVGDYPSRPLSGKPLPVVLQETPDVYQISAPPAPTSSEPAKLPPLVLKPGQTHVLTLEDIGREICFEAPVIDQGVEAQDPRAKPVLELPSWFDVAAMKPAVFPVLADTPAASDARLMTTSVAAPGALKDVRLMDFIPRPEGGTDTTWACRQPATAFNHWLEEAATSIGTTAETLQEIINNAPQNRTTL